MKLIFVYLLLLFSLVNAKKFTAKDCREKMAKVQNDFFKQQFTTADQEEYYRKLQYKNGKCEGGLQSLNNAECGFDGGDCCLNNCGTDMIDSVSLSKSKLFKNVLTYLSNQGSEEKCPCKGFDCPEPRNSKKFGDGKCDPELNNAGCFYDYGDCGDAMLSTDMSLLGQNLSLG